jgi:hypothetical protein
VLDIRTAVETSRGDEDSTIEDTSPFHEEKEV